MKDLSDEIITLEVQPSNRIKYLKSKIQERTGISQEKLSLLFTDKLLEEKRTLSHYNIQNESTLQLVMNHDDSKIYVKTPFGKIITIPVTLKATFLDVKNKISDKEGIPPHRQSLSSATRVFEDKRTLSSCNIKNESTLYLQLLFQNAMPITVMAKSGKTINLDVHPSDTIKYIKFQIQDKEGIPSGHQRLLFGSKILENKYTISDYKIQMASVLHLVSHSQTYNW